MSKDNDAFGPLPKKPAAAFHHPIGFELYDALAMDLHAMKYAEQCVKAEREACAKVCEEHARESWDHEGGALVCADRIRARGEK